MTEIDEEEYSPAVSETAGSVLKAARETAEMTLEQAAEKLHLLKETVVALEEDNASKLPSRVFTLGYLKNYARILGLSESRIMELVREEVEEVKEVKEIKSLQQPRAPKIRTLTHRQVHGGSLFVKAITWLIVIAIIALLVLWWRGAIQLPDWNGFPFPSVTEEQESVETGIDDGSETLTLSIGDKLTSQDETLEDVAAAPDQSVEKDVDEALLELSPQRANAEAIPEAGGIQEIGADAAETSIAPQTTEKTVVSDDVVVVAADSAGETQAGGRQEITLDFSDACWVNVNDAEGKIVLYGDIPAGSSKTIEGTAPFTFVLGNASSVKVSIDGRVYDTTPHAKGGVARFSLGEPGE
ncbi:MAG TPA: hypothetical protein DDW45_09775 [Gammaproteobacteria bacterium]|nr:hypothetical protein [Gammaproteobacteria bacterium]